MRELFRLYLQLAIRRRGPQEVPASALLLILTIAIYYAVSAGCGEWLLPKEGPWWIKSAVDVAFMALWYFGMLSFARKPERFVQTATALFGYQIVLTPFLILTASLIYRLGKDTAWQFPVMIGYLVLIVWLVEVNVAIVKSALEWKAPAAAALVVLQMLVNYALFAYLGGS